MILTIILAILFGTLIGWFFIQPRIDQSLCQLIDEKDKY